MATNLLGDIMQDFDFNVGDIYKLRYGGRPVTLTVITEEEADTAWEAGWVKSVGHGFVPVRDQSNQVRMFSKNLIRELASQFVAPQPTL